MNAAHEDIREEVELPDPEVQRLVHPLDLPEARQQFRNAWLIGALTSVPVSALVAAIVAYLTRSPVPPIIVFLALAVFGAMASRWSGERSWDYIPRKRQDRDRPLPRLWDIVSAGVLALVFGIALLLIVFRLADGDVSAEVRSFTFGGAAVAALLVVGDTLIGLLRPAGRRRALAGLPGAAVVVAATVLAWAIWFDGDADTTLLFWGAVTVAAGGVLAGAGKLWDRRRNR